MPLATSGVTVKERVPTFSATAGDEIASTGPWSSSAMVPVAVAAVLESVRPAAPVSSTTMVSSGSSERSSVTATAMAPAVAPAAMVSFPDASAA